MPEPARFRLTSLDLGIFAVSLAILLLELLLTRVFSVVMFHHFSFLAVSLAMSGIGLGGLIVNLRPRWFRADNITSTGPVLAVVFAFTVITASWVAFNTPIRLQDDAENWRRVVTVLLASLVPFAAGGLVVAHILTFNSERANRLYFFDLMGAGMAAVLFVPTIAILGAPSTLLLAAAIGAMGGACLASGTRARATCGVVAVGLLAVTGANASRGFFDVRFAKGGRPAPSLVTRWNSFSRVEVQGVRGDMERLRAPLSFGFSSQLRAQVRELYLLYDADAMTQIVGFDGDLAKVSYLLSDVTAAPHHVRSNERVLVIGAGGGRDILAALRTGAQHVTGVEINDITVDLMRGRFRDYTGGLYVDVPKVEIINEDGRSFVGRTSARFDLIQASLVDTWAASSAGAYALAENSLYTVEAFRDYFAKLRPDGMLSFSRWYATPPVEVLRVVSLAREALDQIGVSAPARHVAIVRTDSRVTQRPSLATIMIKLSPFTDAEITALIDWSRLMLFDVAYVPPTESANGSEPAFATLLGSRSDAARFVETAQFDLSPTTDDRPFFFDRVPLAAWLRQRVGLPAPAFASSELPLSSRTLLTALVVTAATTLLLLCLPLLLGQRAADTLPIGRRLAWIGYFASLGVGYIVVEVVLIQRFNLYLGNPSYALTVVLFTMLVASGCGALVAQRWTQPAALIATLVVVCVGVGIVALGIGSLIGSTLRASTPMRIAIAALFVAPVAFVMGIPFPTGLRLAGRASQSLVSWAWAVNGGASVFGSVLAVIVSMAAGFSSSLLLAGAGYLVALLLSIGLARADPAIHPGTVAD